MSHPNHGIPQHILIDNATLISLKVTNPNSRPHLVQILPRSRIIPATNGHAPPSYQPHQYQQGSPAPKNDTFSSSDDEYYSSDSDSSDYSRIIPGPEQFSHRRRQQRSTINVLNRGTGPANINYGTCNATPLTSFVHSTPRPLVQTTPTPLPTAVPSREQTMSAATFARDVSRDGRGQAGNTLGGNFAAPAPIFVPLRLVTNTDIRTRFATTPSNPANSQRLNFQRRDQRATECKELETLVRSKLRSLEEGIQEFTKLYEMVEQLVEKLETWRCISDARRDAVTSNVDNATASGDAPEDANANTKNQICSGVASSQDGDSEHQVFQTNTSSGDGPQEKASEDTSPLGGV